MNVRQVEMFAAIMRAGSISGAAQLLGVSPPAVSKALKRIEDQIGYIIFERHAGRLRPTPEARALFAEAEAALDAVARVGVFARALRAPGAGALRLAANPSFGSALLPQVLEAIAADGELRRIEITTVAHEAVVERVLLNQADLGLSMLPARRPLLIDERLGAAPLRLAAPRGWEVLGRASVRLDEILDMPMIGYVDDSPIGETIAGFLGPVLDPADCAIAVRYPMIACMFVEAGLGAAVIDPFVALGGSRFAMDVIPIDDAPLVEAWLIRHGERPLSHLGRRVAGEIRARLEGPR